MDMLSLDPSTRTLIENTLNIDDGQALQRGAHDSHEHMNLNFPPEVSKIQVELANKVTRALVNHRVLYRLQ
jgi:hypothetical protein